MDRKDPRLQKTVNYHAAGSQESSCALQFLSARGSKQANTGRACSISTGAQIIPRDFLPRGHIRKPDTGH